MGGNLGHRLTGQSCESASAPSLHPNCTASTAVLLASLDTIEQRVGSTHALFPQSWRPQKTEKIRVSSLHREQELRAKGQMHHRNAE